MYEIPSEKPKYRTEGAIAVLVLLCIFGFPLIYGFGRTAGYGEGYDKGYGTGQDTGYSDGYSSGRTTGYNQGYDKGYSEGSDAGRFDFYYVKPTQKYGVAELADWLSKWEWIKPYQAGVYDCSEMSAYLEWKLENEGWHTFIVAGDCPFASGKHAWLLVETSAGQYMPVESTDISVVMWEDPNFDRYFEYDHQSETIQKALEYSESEFDWWT